MGLIVPQVRLDEAWDECGIVRGVLAVLLELRPNMIRQTAKSARDNVNRRHIGIVAKVLGRTDARTIFEFTEPWIGSYWVMRSDVVEYQYL